MKITLLLLILILLIIWPVVAVAETINGHEVEWGDSSDFTLTWTDPSVSKGDYVINVIDFNWKGDAVVTVTHGGETQKGIISEGENTIFDFTKNGTYFQGVLIYPSEISNFHVLPVNVGTYPCCPEARITVTASKTIEEEPSLQITMSADWDGKLESPSLITMQIENYVDADVTDAYFSEGNVTINIDGLKIADTREISNYGLTYNPSKNTITRGWSTPLFANNSYFVNLSLRAPAPPNSSSFKISMQAYFKDSKGKLYYATTSLTLLPNPALHVNKSISDSTMLKERTYGENDLDTGYLPKFFGLQTVTVVNVYVTNQQSYPVKSVILNDPVMDNYLLINNSISPTKNFNLINNATLQWVFDLNASERKEFRYEMTSQKVGSFSAPAATAQWDDWGVSKTVHSDRPLTRVYGGFILVSKKSDKTSMNINESATVTTTLENTGDFPIGINVTDSLPDNTTFLSGTTSFSGYLYPSQSSSFIYSFHADGPGELELPPPEITFNKKEYAGSFALLPSAKIMVIDPSKVTPVVTGIGPEITPTVSETQRPIPKSLIDLIGEKAPWLEGAIPIMMLFIAIILMLILHVINRES